MFHKKKSIIYIKLSSTKKIPLKLINEYNTFKKHKLVKNCSI